jgi:serine phosphatase RsbU (regulator of sigma subunit)
MAAQTAAARATAAGARRRKVRAPVKCRGAEVPTDETENVVSEFAAARLGPETLVAALEALPDGVALFDADWTICYVNHAGAALLDRPAAELIGRSIWVALPDVAGSIFHSFLLHARSTGTPVTWQGFYAPAGRWLTATAAVAVDGLLQVSLREVADRLTDGAAPGIERDPAAADEGAERDRLRFLAEVSEAMITTLDTGASATQLAELAVPRLCDWAIVALVDERGGPGEEAWAHHDPVRRGDLDTYLRGRLREASSDPAVVNALLSGEPVQVTTIDQEQIAPSLPTEEVREAWRRLGLTSCVIVPLRARGETFGALAMMNAGERAPHTEMEIATAVEVARRGALALDNARLYGRQLNVAETLQHSLLTPPPQPEDLQIAVRYRPAASHQQVGGDWYDAFPQPDGATLLVIGDVVGHNVDAAAAMGQIRSILRGIAYARPETPAQVLTRVDRVLTGLHLGTLATALVARLEAPAAPTTPGLRTLRWSSAGHLPPLLLRTDGTVHPLDNPPERLLGAGATRPRTDHEVDLHPGDTVVFYTDGLIEYGRTGIDEGITRLTAHLAELADLPLEKICDQLLDRIAPGRADDDIAILAVRYGTEDTDRTA